MPILTIFSAKVAEPLLEPDPELESITNFNSEEVSVRCNSFIERNRIRTICSVTGVFKSFTFELLISLFQRYKRKIPQFQNLSQSRGLGTARSADRSVRIGSRFSNFFLVRVRSKNLKILLVLTVSSEVSILLLVLVWSRPRFQIFVGPGSVRDLNFMSVLFLLFRSWSELVQDF